MASEMAKSTLKRLTFELCVFVFEIVQYSSDRRKNLVLYVIFDVDLSLLSICIDYFSVLLSKDLRRI